MSRTHKPRRCSTRWLDGDCPAGVLAIFEDKREPGAPWTVLYAETYGEDDPRGPYVWGRNMSATPSHPCGIGISFELNTAQAAAYRYREKHRYAKWSSLPEAVKACVRRDLAPEDADTGAAA